MKASPPIQVGITALIVTFCLGWAVWVMFDTRETQLNAAQQRFLSDQRMAWAQEDAQRAIAAKQAADERVKVRAGKLVAALGGPVEAAFKNPELNIGQMVNAVALACAPANSRVSVTVDRFTEFTISVTLRDRLSSAQLAEISQCLLPKSVPYVHSVRFIQNNVILAELDWPAIESIGNWSSVSLQAVEGLLSPANAQEQPAPVLAAADNGSASNPAQADLTVDQKKIESANNLFKESYSKHARAVSELVASLDQASRLDTLLTHERLQARVVWLDQLATRLSAERQFFLNQSAEMERLLKTEQLDPLAIGIIVRNSKNRDQSEAAVYAGVFDTVEAYREQILIFLKAMDDRWGEWQADSAAKQILFTSGDARKAYLSGSEQVTQSAQSVQRAFRAWADYKPAK
jgi:hypothetical protein